MSKTTGEKHRRNFLYKALVKAKRDFLPDYLKFILFKLRNIKKERFICPICRYYGPFLDVHPETGARKHAACPKCGALERHRLQYLVLSKLAEEYDFSQMSILHFAPEPFFREYFRKLFKEYFSTDLVMENVDYKADLRNLPSKDETHDFIFASHVLGCIKDDNRALAEIRRVLKPNGIAVLPEPMVAYETVEYPEPNPHEGGGLVRAPGPDYLEKYALYFRKVEQFSSHDFPVKYQIFVYEDRTCWPTETMPLRRAMGGDRHVDIVPVCFA